MKEPDSAEYGARVRERRMARGLSQTGLGDLSGYSQTNIGWIEAGTMKRPSASAARLSDALRTPINYLLWGTGPKDIGLPIMNHDEFLKNYKTLPPQDQAALSALMLERIEALKEKRKKG